MAMMAAYLETESERCVVQGVRLEAIGRRYRLLGHLRDAVGQAESATAAGDRFGLRIEDAKARQLFQDWQREIRSGKMR